MKDITSITFKLILELQIGEHSDRFWAEQYLRNPGRQPGRQAAVNWEINSQVIYIGNETKSGIKEAWQLKGWATRFKQLVSS